MIGVALIVLIATAMLVVSFAVPGGVILAAAGIPVLILAMILAALAESRRRR